MSMKPHHAVICARCGSVGKARQLDEFLKFNRKEPVIPLCDQCLHLPKHTDAETWKWFRDIGYRLSQEK